MWSNRHHYPPRRHRRNLTEDPQHQRQRRRRQCAISTTCFPGGNGRIQFLLIFVSFCYDFLNAERTASARSTSWLAWRHCSWTRRRKSLWSGAKCWGSKRQEQKQQNATFSLRHREIEAEEGERRYIFELQLFLIFKYCFSLVSSRSKRRLNWYFIHTVTHTQTKTHIHTHTYTNSARARRVRLGDESAKGAWKRC